jgi:ADP-ribose pyrophosphatase YjhB (NUDIX family)
VVVLKRSLFRAFGLLPQAFRRWLIRTIRPSWTAGSVAIVERDDGRWLFVRPVYRKGWTLPGGLVDRGEHPEATAVREMQEELGITVEILGGGWVVIDPEYRRVETIFRASLADGIDPDAIEVTTVELSGVGWFDPEETPELEKETREVMALARQVARGGPSLRVKGDDHS